MRASVSKFPLANHLSQLRSCVKSSMRGTPFFLPKFTHSVPFVQRSRLGRLGQVVVLRELRLQDVERRLRVRLRAVRARVVAAAVELDGGGEVARLLLVVDALHVDVPPRARLEVPPCARELLLEARHVEAVAVEAGEVAAPEELLHLACHVGEGGAVAHYLVGDAVYLRRLLRDRHSGVQQPALRRLGAVGIDADRGKLDNAVLPRVDACRLDVEHDERTSGLSSWSASFIT